jgi:NAD(P)-dependent dehydrogenase (short-subunit alcohol dehydrogenase family)
VRLMEESELTSLISFYPPWFTRGSRVSSLKSIATDSDNSSSTKLLRRVFDTNVFGLMDVTTAALPYLRKSKDGCMVVFGSRSAWRAEIPVSSTIFNSQLKMFIYLGTQSQCLPNLGNRSE